MPPSINAVPLTHSNELIVNRIGERPNADPGVSLPLQVPKGQLIDCAPGQSWTEVSGPSETWTFFGEPERVLQDHDLREFTRMVARLGGVAAVLAEEGESGERHITTFIETESEQLVERIIDAQADIIELYYQESGSGTPSPSPRQYSFHIRVTPKNERGEFALPSGQYLLIPWQP